MKKNTKMYSTAIATALATSALVTVVPTQAENLTFKDVDQSNQFYDQIMNLAERGVVQGGGDGNFYPKLDVRRDHAAKIIAEVLGLDTTDVTNPEFKDVPASHPQYKYIAAIKEAGIISGDGLGNFLPGKTLTRGEMAKIIANAFELEVPADSTTPFTDVKGNIYEQYITALYINDVTKGVGNNKFDPSGAVTREQLAAFVVRAEEVVGEVVGKAVKVDKIDGDTIVVNVEVLILTEELKAVFNENNAAALQDAKVELVVRYKDAPVASLAPVANNNQGEVIGIKSVELPNDNTEFNANGYEIPTVTVTAKGVTISNAVITTFTVAEGATATLENSDVSELIVKGDGKITLAEGVTIEKIVLEEGKTLKDVITNYDEVADLLKDVEVVTVKPDTTPTTPSTGGGSTPTQAQSASNTATNLVTTLFNNITSSPAIQGIGTLTNDNGIYTFTFDVKVKSATLATIKSSIESSKVDLEQLLISTVKTIPTNEFTHIFNIFSVKVENIDKELSITIPSPFSSGADIASVIENTITENALANHLTNLTGVTHDDAKTLEVSDFLDNKGDEYRLTVNFGDGSTLSYNIILK